MTPPGLILLAAGASRRMGAAKQLLPYAGGTLLGHAAAVALATACRPVVVVVGANADAVRAAAGRGVIVAENPDWADGMGTSIRRGLAALRIERPDVAEVLITLGDQPLVTADDLTRLIDARRAAGLPIAAALYAGTLGVPACFAGSALDELAAIPPAAGAKRLLADPSQVVAVPMPSAEIDLDTPADVAAVARASRPRLRIPAPNALAENPGGTPVPRYSPPVDDSLPPILPPGTQVVTSTGAAASILRAPTDAGHAYRVRFPDGSETSLRRAEFSVLSHHQRPGGTVGKHDLWENVIYRCVVGSRAYGLDSDQSDTDRRGVYLPPADRQWSLFGVPEQLENDATQEIYWELQKFLILALKANPNVLECLWTPLVEHATPLADELRAMRKSFLSKLAYQTYNGYVMSQFKKLQQDLRNRGEVKWKHVMHLLRLLLSGIGTLRDGEVPVDARDHRDALLAVRRGERSFDECDAWRLALHREFDAAFARTTLPDRPDYDAANAFLLKARREALP